MRKLIITSFILASFSFTATSTYSVEGMMCGVGCVNKIKAQINSVDGINKCDVDFEKSLMTVDFDEGKVSKEAIAALVNEKTTYKCSVKKEKVEEKKRGLFSRLFNLF